MDLILNEQKGKLDAITFVFPFSVLIFKIIETSGYALRKNFI